MIAKAIDIKRRRERGEHIPIEATTATINNDIPVIEKSKEENQLINNNEENENSLEQVINKI